MDSKKVAVVTGGNKGIGFAIVRGLCRQFNGDVLLTARDEGRGTAAVTELEEEGLRPKFQQLDIDDQASIGRLKAFLLQHYGGLDVLVNNAGIFYNPGSTAPLTEQVEATLRTNYWGTLNVCRALFPILRPHARVVHVSSRGGTMALAECSEEQRQKLTSLTSLEEVNKYMAAFVSDVKDNVFKSKGWPDFTSEGRGESAYRVSKLGVIAMTPLQQAGMDEDFSGQDIVINACCPGYVDTDMTSHMGHLTIDQGADTPVYLALLPPDVTSPRGEFVAEREILDWKKGEGS